MLDILKIDLDHIAEPHVSLSTLLIPDSLFSKSEKRLISLILLILL
jgi:hypothetical protein